MSSARSLLQSVKRTQIIRDPIKNKERQLNVRMEILSKNYVSKRAKVVESMVMRSPDFKLTKDLLSEEFETYGPPGTIFDKLKIVSEEVKILIKKMLLNGIEKDEWTKLLISEGVNVGTILGINLCVILEPIQKMVLFYNVKSTKVFVLKMIESDEGSKMVWVKRNDKLMNTLIPGFGFTMTSDTFKQGEKLIYPKILIRKLDIDRIKVLDMSTKYDVLNTIENKEDTIMQTRRETKSHYPEYDGLKSLEKLKMAENFQKISPDEIQNDRKSILKFVLSEAPINLVNIKGSEIIMRDEGLNNYYLPKRVYLKHNDIKASTFLIGIKNVTALIEGHIVSTAYECIYVSFEDRIDCSSPLKFVILHQSLNTSNPLIKPKLIIVTDRDMTIQNMNNDFFDDYEDAEIEANPREVFNLLVKLWNNFREQQGPIINEFFKNASKNLVYKRNNTVSYRYLQSNLKLLDQFYINRKYVESIQPLIYKDNCFTKHLKEPLVPLKFRDGMLPMMTSPEFINKENEDLLQIASTNIECESKGEFEEEDMFLKYPCKMIVSKRYDGARSHQCVLRYLSTSFYFNDMKIDPFDTRCEKCGRTYIWKDVNKLCCGDAIHELRMHDELRHKYQSN